MDHQQHCARDFGNLPMLVMQTIAKHADLKTRMTMLKVCRSWRCCMLKASCWLDVTYSIPGGWLNPTTAMVEIAEAFGTFHRRVDIRLESPDMVVGFAAMNLICVLADVVPRRIQHLNVSCCHLRSMCRHGENLSISLKTFFERPVNVMCGRMAGLVSVDLSGLTIIFCDPVFRSLYINHGQWLTHLNLQSRSVACRISPLSMRYALPCIPNLQDLRVFMASIDNESLQIMVDHHRHSLRHLSMLCRYSDAYRQMTLSDFGWRQLSRNMPDTYVTVLVSRGFPIDRIENVLMPSIPLRTLILDPAIDQNTIGLICEQYQHLSKLVLMSKPSSDYEALIVEMVVGKADLGVFYVKHRMNAANTAPIRQRRPRIVHNLTVDDRDDLGYVNISDEELHRPMLPPTQLDNQ